MSFRRCLPWSSLECLVPLSEALAKALSATPHYVSLHMLQRSPPRRPDDSERALRPASQCCEGLVCDLFRGALGTGSLTLCLNLKPWLRSPVSIPFWSLPSPTSMYATQAARYRRTRCFSYTSRVNEHDNRSVDMLWRHHVLASDRNRASL
ncbi:hypothetical protein B0H15DRAFT_863163 [Mycena belliarum]|uniref:Uncharacterized protein n=1 Tax=Mycena belliarum TaxID=1033014 RepID=A0AAD6TSI9_9AGAR|nr:hypothetical protein B0H15DRAFT_863163 [Mycena belliae]